MPLLKTSLGVLGLKVFSAIAGLINSILFARILGAEEFGVYSMIFAALGLISALVVLGLPSFIIREVSVSYAQSNWGKLKGLMMMSSRTIGTLAVGSPLLLFLVAWLDWLPLTVSLTDFGLILLLIPFMAFNQLRAAFLKGLNRVINADIPEMLIQPATILLILSLMYMQGLKLNSMDGILVLITGVTLALFVGGWLLYIRYPKPLYAAEGITSDYHWFGSTKVFFAITVAGLLQGQTPLYMVGYLAGSEAAGLFQSAAVVVGVVTIGLTAVNSPLQPRLAKAWGENDILQAQKLVSNATELAFAFAVISALVLFLFAEELLALYGTEYVQAAWVLRILLIGQVINAASGSGIAILLMTGNQHMVLYGLISAVIGNIFLSWLLIPNFGIVGAAIAGAAGLSIWNIVLAFLVWKKTKIISVLRLTR